MHCYLTLIDETCRNGEEHGLYFHYRIHWLCRVPVTLGKGQFALGKLFAKCNTRQTPLGKRFPRHNGLCRVSDFGHSAKTLPRALALGKLATWRHPRPALCRVPNGGHSAKFQTLPSVGVWHSAKCRPRVAPCGRFAECWILALGKRLKLCRVPGF